LGMDLAIIDKGRPRANVAEVMHIIGEIEGRTCLLVDDIIDTAGTLCSAAKALKAQGAKKVVAYCTHPVLSGKAIENLNNSELDQLVVADSIPLSEARSEEHTSELQSRENLVCRLLLEKKKIIEQRNNDDKRRK